MRNEENKRGGVKGIVEVKAIYTQLQSSSQDTSRQDGNQKYTPSFLGWIQTGEIEKGGDLTACFWHQILGTRLNGLLGTHSEKGGI